jgi:hypothetical protein
LLLAGTYLRAQEGSAKQEGQSKEAQEGIEVQTRGPVHEAFDQPVVRGAGPSPVIKKKPPEPINELPPDQKPEGERVTWIPGYWAWDGDRNDFLWVSGLWRNAPPNMHWIPGYWDQADGGYEWVSGHWASEASSEEEVLPAPPDPVAESPPAAPDQDSEYVPGCWVYQDDRYLWRPGFWHRHRAGWIWMPASYFSTPAGYVFVDGYWDYDFNHRGLLFAPVYFNRAVWGRGNWSYRPSYVVPIDFLLGALFANASYRHYYYGDYFDPAYGRAGYLSWLDYRIGRNFYDPAYSYYRWSHRSDPGWDRSLRAQYTGRREGTVARPPRTFAALQRSAGKGPLPVTRLAALKTSAVKLQPVSQKEMQAVHAKQATQLRALSQQRAKSQAEVKQKRAQSGQATSARHKVSLPTPKATSRPLQKAPPPTPVHPKPEARPVPQKQPRAQPKVTPPSQPKVTPPPRPSPPPPKPSKAPAKSDKSKDKP